MAILLLATLISFVTPVAAGALCVGDCNGDLQVTVDELVLGINIALGETDVDQCTAIDASGDRQVTVDEIVAAVTAALDGCPAVEPRLIVLSRRGQIASLDVAAPWTPRASGDLGAPIASARCRDGRCLVVHPSTDSISVVGASDLMTEDPITLEKGSDPRDVAIVDDHSAIVSQYGNAALLEIDLNTRVTKAIDLSALTDEDGLPEALRMATCGRRVFVQLQRVDHRSGVPASIPGTLAVIDLDRDERDRVVDVDPETPGVQGIDLINRPNFDMPVDCDAGVLYVAEPKPLLQGGGRYEQIDLDTLTASEFPIDTGPEIGGFEILEPDKYWLITHTEVGPGPSSHLNFFGGGPMDTHNTFAEEHVNDLAFDRQEDLLFYPDPCATIPTNPNCDGGVVIFHAHTGEAASAEPVDVGFPPIEVVVSR